MKKLMIATANLYTAVGVSALESANTVGYNTAAMVANSSKATYNMMGVPFTGTSLGFRLNYDLGMANATGGADADHADLIQIWDPTLGGGVGGYEQYYYYYDSSDKPIAEGGWNGWWDFIGQDFETVHPSGLEAGATFWYLAYQSALTPSITTSGAVLGTDDKEVEFCKGKYNMITCPYPVRFNPNDATQVEWTKCTGGADADHADLIQIWDPTLGGGVGGYEQYYYYYDPSDTPIAQGGWNGWWDFVGQDFGSNHPTGLDVGKPFWYLALGTYSASDMGLITFFSPL